MTIKLASLKADLDREAKGDWQECPDLPGVEFNVSSILSPNYTLQRDLAFQRLARQYKKKPVPESERIKTVGKLFCDHILHGWRGFDVEYTPEVAVSILTDPAYRIVVGAVEWCAAKMADVDIEYVEEEIKNSAAPSASA